MRIGVVSYLDCQGGGVRQYSLMFMRALASFVKANNDLRVTVLHEDGIRDFGAPLDPTWTTLPVSPPSAWRSATRPVRVLFGKTRDVFRRIVGEGPHAEAWRGARMGIKEWIRRRQVHISLDKIHARSHLSAWYRANGIDLMLYPLACPTAFETDIPYVVAIHDLQHRLKPTFTEVSASGEWAGREYLYRNAARFATLILADSAVGKDDIIRCYGNQGVTDDRVKVLSYCATPYLTIGDIEPQRKRAQLAYGLPVRYLLYPANFWPSKNHIGLVLALGHLRQVQGFSIPLVLTGSGEGELRDQTFRTMMDVAQATGVAEQIMYLGYVPDDLIAGVFAGATAVVMPTFFGPTNLPVVEAWQFGCPVLSSRIRGVVEQVGDAGLLVDPESVEEIANGIERLWTDEALRTRVAQRGRDRGASYTEADFQKQFSAIMREAISRVSK